MKRPCERIHERLLCMAHGHRDVPAAPAYAEMADGAVDKSLHYCAACGGPVWESAPHAVRQPRTWAATGLKNL